jgi:hypothetical protein
MALRLSFVFYVKVSEQTEQKGMVNSYFLEIQIFVRHDKINGGCLMGL